MKNFVKTISGINNKLFVMIVQLQSGEKVCALVKEKGKYLYLYNPKLMVNSTNKKGENMVKLLPWQPELTVESSNTIIKKKTAILFLPSASFKAYYLEKITTKKTVIVSQTNTANTTLTESQSNNVIDFVKFKKAKETANTGGGNDAA